MPINDGSLRFGQSFIGNDNGYVYCSGGSENSKNPCIDTYEWERKRKLHIVCVFFLFVLNHIESDVTPIK